MSGEDPRFMPMGAVEYCIKSCGWAWGCGLSGKAVLCPYVQLPPFLDCVLASFVKGTLCVIRMERTGMDQPTIRATIGDLVCVGLLGDLVHFRVCCGVYVGDGYVQLCCTEYIGRAWKCLWGLVLEAYAVSPCSRAALYGVGTGTWRCVGSRGSTCGAFASASWWVGGGGLVIHGLVTFVRWARGGIWRLGVEIGLLVLRCRCSGLLVLGCCACA